MGSVPRRAQVEGDTSLAVASQLLDGSSCVLVRLWRLSARDGGKDGLTAFAPCKKEDRVLLGSLALKWLSKRPKPFFSLEIAS